MKLARTWKLWKRGIGWTPKILSMPQIYPSVAATQIRPFNDVDTIVCKPCRSARSVVVSFCLLARSARGAHLYKDHPNRQAHNPFNITAKLLAAFVSQCVALLCKQCGRNFRIGDCKINAGYSTWNALPSSLSPSSSQTSFSLSSLETQALTTKASSAPVRS